MTIQEFLQGLKNVIKKGMRAIAKAIAKHGIFSLVTFAAIAAFLTAVIIYKQQYEPLVVPAEPLAQQSAPAPSSPPSPPPPRITTAITKDQDEWMWHYCREQATKLPEPPFTYKKRVEEGKWIPIPPTYVGKRMPKNERGYSLDSITCRYIYSFDDEEAYPSVGVPYKFDANVRHDFAKRVNKLYIDSMDSTWEQIVLGDKERAGHPDAGAGFPLLFMRENPELGTVEYADMGFAIEYWVKFTVYEKPK